MNIRWKQVKEGDLKLQMEIENSDGKWVAVPMVGHDGKFLNEHPRDRFNREQKENKKNKKREKAEK